MYMEHQEVGTLHQKEETKASDINEAVRRVQGKNVCFLKLFDTAPQSETLDIHDDVLETTLKKMCREWFGLNLCNEHEVEDRLCDFYVAVEPAYNQFFTYVRKLPLLQTTSEVIPGACLLVVCRSLECTSSLRLSHFH